MPIYDLTYKGKTYSIESESPLSEQEIDTIFKNDIEGKELPESKPTEIPLNESEVPKATPADIGLSQSFAKGLTFGTAPLIAGGVDVIRNIGKNISSGKLDYLKDTGKSFEEGRKRFLESQGQYEKEAPVAATLADIAGGLAMPVGSAGAVAKGLSTLQKIKQGAKVGSALGGAYGLGTGLSENQDKAVDIAKGLKGAGIGAGIGALGGTLATSIPQGIKKLVTSKDVGRKLDYIVPSGTQKKTIENIIENPKVQKEAVKKGFNMNYDIYLDDASKRIVGINNEIKKIANEAYKDIPDTTKINLSKTDTLGKMQNAFKEYVDNTDLLPNTTVLKETEEILNNLQNKLSKNKSSISDPLMSEARKYKSIDEFVNAQKNPVLDNFSKDNGKIIRGVLKLDDGKLKFSVSDMDDSIMIIDNINVKTQKKGTGSKLMREAENIASENGYKKIELGAYPQNDTINSENLKNFYKNLGYDVIESNRLDGVDYYDMSKNIYSGKKSQIKTKSQLGDVWNKAQKEGINGKDDIDFRNLKEMTSFLNERADKFARDGDYTTAKMYNKMRKALVEARDEVPQIKKASALYEDMMNAKSKLENALGVDLENPKNVSTKILTDLRDNKGNLVNSQIEDVVGIFSKRPETKHLTDINDKIKLAQTSYDLRPKEESKILSAIASKGKSLIQELTGTSPAEKARNLARRLSSGQITKEQLAEPFNLIGSPMFEESVNKFVQGQEAFGGKIPTMANAVKKLQLSRYTLPKITIRNLIKQKEEENK